MLSDLQTGIILLVKSALKGNTVCLPSNFNISDALKVAEDHHIMGLVFTGLENCGISKDDPDMHTAILNDCKAMSISENQLYLISKICLEFDKNNIDYVLLKGSVLKKMYPKHYLRYMNDADILIRVAQYDRIKPLMQSLGFGEITESDHEYVWEMHGMFLVEIHKRLIPSYNKDYYSYFGDGWDRAVKLDNGTNEYVLSDEDMFVYLFTHFAKHYRDAGVGIQHFTDLWVYLNSKPDLDINYIKSELNKLKLYEFYINISDVLNSWFNDVPFSEKSEFITNVIFDSGAFGNGKTHTTARALKESKVHNSPFSVRILMALSVIFPGVAQMKANYPILNRFAVFLPACWIIRIFRVLFVERNKIKMQYEKFKFSSSKNIAEYQKLLNYVGLDYNFKE